MSKSNNNMKRKAQDSVNAIITLPQKQRKSDHDGTQDRKIAKDVNIGHFAESRAIEIQALTEAVKDVGGNHIAFQKLPRHMRRRAMSHNIKRVPRRLHDQVRSELDKVKAASKRPSRRYRRKPSNLLSEYERRKRRISWLETHIWHAKRFKMVEKWGYRLALHPNEKSIRACYRAVRRHCLLQDVSYESYIEIKGRRESITRGLKHLTSEETGLTFAAKMTSRGTRQGSLVLYRYDCYPCNAIGLITYLWRPQIAKDIDDDGNSTLWICCHPAFYDEAVQEIKKCFQSTEGQKDISHEKLPSDAENQTQFVETENNVIITSLKDHLLKLRLFGPKSTLLLRETLKLWDFDCLSEVKENGKVNGDSCAASEGYTLWWKDFYGREENQRRSKQQREAWETLTSCQSQAEVPSHCVISAVVRDPRLLLPPRRTKVFPNEKDSEMRKLPKELFNTAEISDSPVWEESIRLNVKKTKILEKDLNSMKSRHLIPGTPLELGEKESRIPILLVQRPGFSLLNPTVSSRPPSVSTVQEGYASGWDIILPSGWGMAFWIALVYRGARVGGLREAHSISLQARQLNQIKDIPDSAAGKSEAQAEGAALELKHKRRPPAKRPNYTKLGFESPFSFSFNQLCKEWMMTLPSLAEKYNKGLAMGVVLPTNKDFYVLRHRKTSQLLNHAMTDIRNFLHDTPPQGQKQSGKQQKKFDTNPLNKLLSDDRGRQLIACHRMALVPVCVSILYRGVPAPHGHICKPSKEDLTKLDKDKHYGGPVEGLHPDPDAPRRKEERKERLRARRKKKQGKKVPEKESGAAVKDEISKMAIGTRPGSATTKLDDSEVGKMPMKADSKPSTVINCTTRQLLGFITKGDFNLGQGQGSGMGFCSLAALLHIIAEQGKRKNCVVLVRNPMTTQYRFASISLVL